MDAFEEVVAEILWMEGYWVRTSVKVELTKPEKKLIGRASTPRWELDVVGYRGRENVLQVVECKSYLDSTGVRASGFDGTSESTAGRFKLFNDPELREVVFDRLARQMVESGACSETPSVKLALACGKMKNKTDRQWIRQHFESKGWELWDEAWLRERLTKMSGKGYENHVSAVVTKLLLRGTVEG